jgi:transcription elongation factor GreB
MGRYRPPPPKSSLYITRQGYLALQEELDTLWRRRARVTRALAAAAAEGDRSENAEYIYRKKELREIDCRVRYLQKRLPLLKVVTAPPSDLTRVFFGARVTLEDEDGAEVSYRIVGPDELDPARGWISMDSPMARAMMNRALDDEVIVHTPNGNICYCITAVSYAETLQP